MQSSYDGYDLEPAYRLASEQLAEIEDTERLCLKSGAKYLVTGSQQEIAMALAEWKLQLPIANTGQFRLALKSEGDGEYIADSG